MCFHTRGSEAVLAAVTVNIEHIENVNAPRGGGEDFFFFFNHFRSGNKILHSRRVPLLLPLGAKGIIFTVTAATPPM